MKEPRFVSNGRIFNVFGGHSANDPGLSPSISLIVFITSPNYFGVSQYHTTPSFGICLSVPNHLRVCQNASPSLHTEIQPLITYDQYPVTLDPFLSGQWSHSKRTLYVLKLYFQIPFATSPNHPCFVGPLSAALHTEGNCK